MGEGERGPWDNEVPPPVTTEGGSSETGGASDPKRREEQNMVRAQHVRTNKLFRQLENGLNKKWSEING